jgi:TolA-binding protein
MARGAATRRWGPLLAWFPGRHARPRLTGQSPLGPHPTRGPRSAAFHVLLRSRPWRALFALCAVLAHSAAAQGQEAPAPAGSAEPSLLDGYLTELDKRKLAPPPARSVEELSQVLEQAQNDLLAGRKAEAAARLLDALEGPRFRDFREFPPYQTAALMLSGILLEQHALKSAQRTIDPVLAAGPESEAFGPAYRRAVDIAIARGDLEASAAHLQSFGHKSLPEDPANELRYLQALAAYERDDFGRARPLLSGITARSRYYASAQYLLGAMAAKQKNFKEAEARFCSIATAGKDDLYSFYVDGRFFPVRDLAQLGLGRVAHETARADDAFYYYFQVPNDSNRVSEALFEAAWASYEGNDHDAALDSLDQLEARYPRSPFAAEAGVLRGYVHLSRCEFVEAEQQLMGFERTFSAVLREIDESLESPARRQRVYRDLVARADSIERLEQSAEKGEPSPDSLLLALVAADPAFYRLHAQIRALDAELSSTGNVPDELSALAQRVQGKDAPAPRLAELDEEAGRDAIGELNREIEEAKSAIDAFSEQLAELSRAGGDKGELRALSDAKRKLDRRVDDVARQLREALAHSEDGGARPSAAELGPRLLEDRVYVEALRGRALKLRAELEAAASAAGERSLSGLRERLAKELRRARIGRIDAVMGSKRQVELQVESLAAGRFPPELTDPLRMQSLLRDDEEYWPFEGEDWPDEFVERYAEEEE